MFENIIIFRQSIFLHPCKELRNLLQHKSVLSTKTFKNFEEVQLQRSETLYLTLEDRRLWRRRRRRCSPFANRVHYCEGTHPLKAEWLLY